MSLRYYFLFLLFQMSWSGRLFGACRLLYFLFLFFQPTESCHYKQTKGDLRLTANSPIILPCYCKNSKHPIKHITVPQHKIFLRATANSPIIPPCFCKILIISSYYCKKTKHTLMLLQQFQSHLSATTKSTNITPCYCKK